MEINGLVINFDENIISYTSSNRVSPKVMAVLKLLLENKNEVVTRETLLDEAWSREFVSDELITRAISDLRRALRESLGGLEKSVETIPKKGYKLNFDLLESITREASTATKTTSQNSKPIAFKISFKAGAISIVACIALGLMAYLFITSN
ncbi:winged helix-turn-helix domain-containing protein [Alteromonas lipolytica]|uniref:OmpR/PhoB-type domain-containing protein n=1 Tax=Alteromonas lipolytica TaxID=1856405 RepID=A0A1E8FH71_9ALTE|nr:winged helix-turn-helix domain-containing protein [Alteromonas lipolytica]OFI35271.1 hypothetical protein BFC17_17210 [Alteromonas lipolytica]GGF58143.1 hypothetical protein GCM10011338_08040 [Alteromonas lipolytica]